MKKLALVTLALTVLASILGQFVPNGKLAGVEKAEAEYAAVAARVMGFAHPGIGKILVDGEFACTGFGWKGKILTVAHCQPNISVEMRKQVKVGDPAVALDMDQVGHQIANDLYEVGQECSPDLRWWGATTGEWRSLKWEDISVKEVKQDNEAAMKKMWQLEVAMQNAKQNWPELHSSSAIAETYVEQAEYALAAYQELALGQEFCFEGEMGSDPSSVGHFRHGDSGGPLMAGDEPIAVVSSGNDTTMWNCFSAMNSEVQPRLVFRDKTLNQWAKEVRNLRRGIDDFNAYN